MVGVWDVWRAVILAELLAVSGMYAWAVAHYVARYRLLTDPQLRAYRLGQALRVTGCLLLTLLLAVAVVGRFGTGDNGRLLSNVLVQIVVVMWAAAWMLLDWQRFRPRERAQAREALRRVEVLRGELLPGEENVRLVRPRDRDR